MEGKKQREKIIEARNSSSLFLLINPLLVVTSQDDRTLSVRQQGFLFGEV